MAIYSEEEDPNVDRYHLSPEDEKKEDVINDINDIIKEFGGFSTYDVEADHSPYANSMGRLVALMEEFDVDEGRVYVYDPTSHSGEELDKYDECYWELDLSQLEWILELAQNWAEKNED